MTNRITGTNSGIDVDSVVKQSLSTQQNKIDKAYQQQMVYQYQQEQLKEIVEDVQKFYDKYLDILSGDSLLKGTAFETAKFTGVDSTGAISTAVTAKGYAGADISDYTVTVSQLAQKATTSLKLADVEDGNTLAIKMGDKIATAKVVTKSNGEIDMEATANALNTDLKKQGINVTAKYSQFEKGIVLESGEMGEDVSFEVSKDYSPSTGETVTNDFIRYYGKNSQGLISKGNSVYEINSSSNIIYVDNVQFTLNSTTGNTTTIEGTEGKVEDLKTGGSNTTTITDQKNGITTIINNGKETTSKVYDGGVTIKISSDKPDEVKVYGNLEALEVKDGETSATSEDGKITTTIEKKDGLTTITTVKIVNENEKIITTVIKEEGKDDKINTDVIGHNLNHLEENDNLKVYIESSDGTQSTLKENGEVINTKANSNGTITKSTTSGTGTVTEITSGSVKLTGETDISGLKDTIINFVNDYNNIMESINGKLWETRDKDYMPLTEEQKKEMSESEIEAWEKKAKTGLLRNDNDLKRIQNSMKTAMSSMMSSTGLTLESIGIEPVDNYTTKNGMYKIDEDKLTKALQNNAEEVKDLFTRASTSEKDSAGNTKVTDKGGVLTQLQSILKSEFKSTSSSLSKRIGFEGTSTESANTLTKNITKQKTLITELKQKYTTRETALYKKYSNLEVMLEKLNAQTNSLYSMLGIS